MAATRDEVLRYGDGVTALMVELGKLVAAAPPAVGQQALAAALWRKLNGDGLRDGEFYLEGVRLLDGGRRIIAECLMVPPKGTRSELPR